MMSFLKNVLDNDLIFSLKVRGTFVMFVCLDDFKKGIQLISVPTDRRSFRTSPKKILEDWSVQDLKIARRTSFWIQEL